ncbi:cyclin-dependent protein kinase inhibitor SMR6 [Oryza brachyantha]|uniref:cyclin-dependent protein kinase inhibitor SMR6 n=1 Tax=Oryza brachyantha TaxID=4533 RepID=UPI001AD99A38|nr:cyclin-dependent protein kinase inhibitor SMR6 [Oryza brachyantha]
MGFQEVKRKLHLHGSVQVEGQADSGEKEEAVWVLAAGEMTLPLPVQLRPVKVSRRRRHGGGGGEGDEEDEEDEVTTPRGEGCRIPAEAATCPPAPKKPRAAAVSIVAGRRCNCDDGGDSLEFFRVPADLEAVFVNRVAKAN